MSHSPRGRAVVELARADLPGRVLLALVSDEEHVSMGAEDAAARYVADGCVLVEPSEGRLILGHKGFVWAELETAGRAAQGSRWDLGVSRVPACGCGRMGRIVAARERFDRDELRARVDPLVDPLAGGGAGS